MVAGNLCLESTRAASITAAVPEPSSLAPGASLVASMTSLTRLSIWPEMITTRFGSVVPRWIAKTLVTLVGAGTRRPVTTSEGVAIVRHPPQAAGVAAETPLGPTKRRADAALGVGLRRKRMPRPKETSRSTMERRLSPRTSSAIA
jgi:hypothetical protein